MERDLNLFWLLVRRLVEKGYVLRVSAVFRSSLHGVIENALIDGHAVDLQYRDPSDEQKEYAQGLSWDAALDSTVVEICPEAKRDM